jgi:Flp pilus assembly protein TadD
MATGPMCHARVAKEQSCDPAASLVRDFWLILELRRPSFDRAAIDPGGLGVTRIAFLLVVALVGLACRPYPGFAASNSDSSRGTTAHQRCYDDSMKGNSAAALTDCSQAITFDPNDVGAYSNRCAAYRNLGNLANAIADCTQALKLNPKDFAAIINRCLTYYDSQDYANAITDCTQSMTLEPNNPKPYLFRGEANIALKNYTSAVNDLTEAIRLNPRNTSAINNRAVALENLGRKADAIAGYQRTLAFDPANQFALAALKRLGVASDK